MKREPTRIWRIRAAGKPAGLELEAEPTQAPGPGEALVRIEAVGLNRSDLLYLEGRYFRPPAEGATLGQEAVGRIVSLGEGVAESPLAGRLVAGQRVGLLPGRVDFVETGSFRSLGCYAVEALLPVPDSITAPQGAALWLTGLTAVGLLRAARVTPEDAAGKTVLVTAASSGVGVSLMQIARGWGARVLASTSSNAKREALAPWADAVIVARSGDELEREIDRVTEGGGFDAALDPVGAAYVDALYGAAARRARIVYYGTLSGNAGGLDLRTQIFKDLVIEGFTVYRLLEDEAGLGRAVSDVIDAVRRGKLRPIVAERLPFESAPRALELLAENRHVGKIVLDLAADPAPEA